MKIFVLLLVVLILLGGAAAGVSIYFDIGPLPGLLASYFPQAVPGPPPVPKRTIVDIGSFSIPVVRNHNITQKVALDLAMDIDPASLPAVTQQLVRLQNAFTIEFYDFVPAHPELAQSEGAKKILHDRLMKIAAKMLGTGTVRDVILKGIYDR